MSISHTMLGANVHQLKINGPLNGRQAQALEQKFWDVHGCGAKQIIIDLEDVPFIDSQGLTALVRGFKVFGSKKHDFRLAALSDQPRLLLELTMFNRIFQVFDTVDEAVQSIPVWATHRAAPNLAPQPVM